MAGRIGYLVSRFPHLPETFILREMNELERQGWELSLYPLIVPKQPVVHPNARPWVAQARHLPFVSRAVVEANVAAARATPGLYAGIWRQALEENRTSPNLLVRAVGLLPKAFYAAQLMQAEGIRHIHAHYATHPAFVAWVIHQWTGISYSMTVHAHDIFVHRAMLETKVRDAAFVVAISEYNREYLAEVLGTWVGPKTHVIHCGVPLQKYHVGRSTRPDAFGQDPFRVLSIGSLQPYKGHSYLIEACRLLRTRGVPFRCQIVGDGELRAELAQKIHRQGLESCVELLGPKTQEEIAELLPTADCYVQPSIITGSGKMEGIPVALMEAMACELPVIATSISGVPELVSPGRTGYLVPPADARALAEAMLEVYKNPSHARSLARSGRRLVRHEFDLEANVRKLGVLFEGILGEDRAGLVPVPVRDVVRAPAG